MSCWHVKTVKYHTWSKGQWFFLKHPWTKTRRFSNKSWLVGNWNWWSSDLWNALSGYIQSQKNVMITSLMGRLEVWPETAHNSQTAEELVLWVRLCVRPRRWADSPWFWQWHQQTQREIQQVKQSSLWQNFSKATEVLFNKKKKREINEKSRECQEVYTSSIKFIHTFFKKTEDWHCPPPFFFFFLLWGRMWNWRLQIPPILKSLSTAQWWLLRKP